MEKYSPIIFVIWFYIFKSYVQTRNCLKVNSRKVFSHQANDNTKERNKKVKWWYLLTCRTQNAWIGNILCRQIYRAEKRWSLSLCSCVCLWGSIFTEGSWITLSLLEDQSINECREWIITTLSVILTFLILYLSLCLYCAYFPSGTF